VFCHARNTSKLRMVCEIYYTSSTGGYLINKSCTKPTQVLYWGAVVSVSTLQHEASAYEVFSSLFFSLQVRAQLHSKLNSGWWGALFIMQCYGLASLLCVPYLTMTLQPETGNVEALPKTEIRGNHHICLHLVAFLNLENTKWTSSCHIR
jgi:hypothetical protein